jgi:hypothetical protein
VAFCSPLFPVNIAWAPEVIAFHRRSGLRSFQLRFSVHAPANTRHQKRRHMNSDRGGTGLQVLVFQRSRSEDGGGNHLGREQRPTWSDRGLVY